MSDLQIYIVALHWILSNFSMFLLVKGNQTTENSTTVLFQVRYDQRAV